VRAALIVLAAAGVLAAGCTDSTSPGQAAQTAPGDITQGPTTADPSTQPPPATGVPATPPAAPPQATVQAPPPEVGAPAGAASTRCHTAELTGSLRSPGAAAGNRYLVLVLTNSSTRACTLYGYGGIQLADAHRRGLPTAQRRDPSHPPSTIRLEPGISASTALHWTVVPGAGESQTGQCEPTPAMLLVIPPDETTQLAVPWRYGVVCGHGTIDQWGYSPGLVSPSDGAF
jgi:hypothetical protein